MHATHTRVHEHACVRACAHTHTHTHSHSKLTYPSQFWSYFPRKPDEDFLHYQRMSQFWVETTKQAAPVGGSQGIGKRKAVISAMLLHPLTLTLETIQTSDN